MTLNPASSGWVNKYVSLFPVFSSEIVTLEQKEIYRLLVKTGFFYGVSSELAILPNVNNTLFSIDDYSKVNLFTALMLSYKLQHPNAIEEEAFKSIEKFYKSINKGKKGILSLINFSKDTASNVESILSARLQESNPIIKKGSSSFFTLIVLSIDIIAFYGYLKNPKNNTKTYTQLEYIYNKISYLALSAKINKTKHDNNMLALFRETFSNHNSNSTIIKGDVALLPISVRENSILINQLLNLCLLAIQDDKEIDTAELVFLSAVAAELGVKELEVSENIKNLYVFKESYGKQIRLFSNANPVRHFYKETTRTVRMLILKNADRIVKELVESKELLQLLGQSTLRELNDDEKKKVKEQLLDICKTVPSLTIFIIPGGSLLLPLLIKMIPQLLPSAFNENRIEKTK